MINTIPFTIGFIIYVGFCLITFNIYSKKTGITKILGLIFIYLYYTFLAGYVIFFVDSYVSFFEKIVQTLIYAAPCGVFLFSHYKTISQKSEIESGYGESPDSKIF